MSALPFQLQPIVLFSLAAGFHYARMRIFMPALLQSDRRNPYVHLTALAGIYTSQRHSAGKLSEIAIESSKREVAGLPSCFKKKTV